MNPPRPAQPADPPSAAPSDTPRAATAGELPARRSPDLFAREPVSAERLLQHGVIRAFQARAGETLDCYERVLCRGEAEPPRAGVRFVITIDGRVSDARVAFITEYHRAPETRAIVERAGDPDGELARCLLAVTRRLTVTPPASAVPAETSFVFGVDTAGCPH